MADDYSIPHGCRKLPKRQRPKPGTGLVGPGKLVVWAAGLGRDHYDHPGEYDLVAANGDAMITKVAAHVGISAAELERRFEECLHG